MAVLGRTDFASYVNNPHHSDIYVLTNEGSARVQRIIVRSVIQGKNSN